MKIEAVSLQDLQILAAAGVVLVAEHRNQTKLHSGEMISQHFFNADGLEVAYLFVDTYAQWKDTVATPAFQKFQANEIDAAGLADELKSGWDQVNR